MATASCPFFRRFLHRKQVVLVVGGGGGGARDGRTAGTFCFVVWLPAWRRSVAFLFGSFRCVVRFGGLALRHRFFFVLRGGEITAGRVALPMRDASRSCTSLAWGSFHLFWTVPRAVRGFLDCFMRDLACCPASHLCQPPAALCCRLLGPRPRRPLLTVFVAIISYGTMLAAVPIPVAVSVL